MIRIGYQEPEGITSYGKHVFMEDGMHYELFKDEQGEFYVAADHEDVGLVTWYRADVADWIELENAGMEVIG